MPDTNASDLSKSDTSENQEKTVDMYFGVFFDVQEVDHWINTVGNYRKKGEKYKEEFETDVQTSDAYKVGMIVEGTAKNVINALPNNPVSNVIQKGLDIKDKVVGIKDKVEGKVDEISGLVDDKTNSVLDSASNTGFLNLEGIDMLGSKRSIISLMEPAYCGGAFIGKEIFTNYDYRFYLQGGIFAKDMKPEKSTNGDTSESDDAQNEEREEKQKIIRAQEAAKKALQAIEKKIGAAPKGQKLSLHFDLFGYAKDNSINNLKPEINSLKGKYPDINELNIDYTGLYNDFNNPDEVRSDLGGDTLIRFRDGGSKFLEKEKNG